MDEREFKETAKRLKDVNAVVAKLDPALRGDAWTTLRPYVTVDGNSPRSPVQRTKKSSPDASLDEDTLIETFESEKDADNLYLTLAILYLRHGRGPFSKEQVKEAADAHHLSIPDRFDVTLKGTKRVRRQGSGWKISSAGETWLKEKFGVVKGKVPFPDGS